MKSIGLVHLSDEIVIKDTETVSASKINSIFKKLLENDLNLCPDTAIFPTIWECKWYNNSNIAGYNEGDLFWYNVEDPKTFIDKNHKKIYNYAKNNMYLDTIIKPYNPYDLNSIKLYSMILSGYNFNGQVLSCLYDLGHLSGNFQIKYSLKNNNKDPLSVTSSYANVFEDDTERISSVVSSSIDDLILDHIQNYHANSQMFTTDELIAIESDYLDSDMKNLLDNDSQNAIVGMGQQISNTVGLDYIVKFVNDKHNNKWFRLWHSGLLEHGGIINIETTTDIIPVQLNWQYEQNGQILSAPTYNMYVKNAPNVYNIYNKYDNGYQLTQEQIDNFIPSNLRYTVSLTPYKEPKEISTENIEVSSENKIDLEEAINLISTDTLGFLNKSFISNQIFDSEYITTFTDRLVEAVKTVINDLDADNEKYQEISADIINELNIDLTKGINTFLETDLSDQILNIFNNSLLPEVSSLITKRIPQNTDTNEDIDIKTTYQLEYDVKMDEFHNYIINEVTQLTQNSFCIKTNSNLSSNAKYAYYVTGFHINE